MARKALIIGGGIGGMAAAVAVRRAGCDVAVYERAIELAEVGAGITIWANAIRALEQLGLKSAIERRAIEARSGAIRSGKGKVLVPLPVEALKERVGNVVAAVLHRAELLAILREAAAAAGAHVYLGHSCTGFAQDADGVTATFANGASARGDVLIGADGLRSAVRAQVLHDGPPRYAGYTAWRAVVPFDTTSIPVGESWGRGKRFGLVPMGDGRLYWFATANAPEGQPPGAGGHKQDLLDRFADWHDPILEVLRRTPPEAILRNDIYDRDPVERWGEGRVTLLGDAAHPTTPNLGQGACQAIEDAMVLGSWLFVEQPLSWSLLGYEGCRERRAAWIVRQSRKFGEVGQWENPIACGVRDVLLRLTPVKGTVKTFVRAIGEAQRPEIPRKR